MPADKIPDEIMQEARVLRMKLHGATELGQRTNWLAEALMARDKRAAEIARNTDPNAHDIATAILTYGGRNEQR